jgi:L-asparaginase II
MVAGSKRYCTDMMQITAPQIIGKTGAEGIFCLSLSEQKIGVCIKIDDGKMLPQYNVAQAFINATGLFDNETLIPLQHYLQEPLTNFNKFTVGEIKAVDGLFDRLEIDLK